MKKIIIQLFIATLTLTMILSYFTACGDVPVENLVLSNAELTINVGNASSVSCTVLPENATDQTVSWSSSNNAVATVSNAGVITAVSAGTCTITVSSEDITATVNVIVKKPVEQVVLNKTDVTIKEEETFTFTCTIVPNDASEKNVTWTSSNSSVATVNANGTITGVKAGTCTITASVDGKSAIANITIKEKGPDFKKLYNEIDSDVQYGWELGSDGSYLMADTNVYNLDDYSSSAIWYSIKNMNKKLGLPDSLNNDMAQTSWSMGRQNQTFETAGVTVTWTYHPDKGMEVTYKLINN
ncbi:MAG: Ig domain-containing protein [Clostridia bacterium]|nr:Ig domain-containing protein [Clostridia bacterium]